MQLLEEIKKKYHLRNDQEIAELLNKDSTTISKWRTNGEIPARAEREILKLLGWSGDMRNKNINTVTVNDHQPSYDDEIIAAVVKIMRELSPKGRYEVMHYASALRIKENNILVDTGGN